MKKKIYFLEAQKVRRVKQKSEVFIGTACVDPKIHRNITGNGFYFFNNLIFTLLHTIGRGIAVGNAVNIGIWWI